MAENDSELLNTVYREISERLGINAAMTIYEMFKGQQISFPTRFFDSAMIIVQKSAGQPLRIAERSPQITAISETAILSM